ncbi:MAG: 4'-phosphopantetheinyl transferase superfamily protein [Gemmatimonadota bacterium]
MHPNVGARLGTVRVRSGAADIWFAWVDQHADVVATLSRDVLSDAERSRLGRYRNLASAGCYVITRALVRRVLGEHLAIPPNQVTVRVTDLGKPVVSDDLHFNVSHSGDLIVMAVSAERAVGVDVERRRPVVRADALIARWLTPVEQQEVRRLTADGVNVSDAFLRVWSTKESGLKAIGVGISGATTADLTNVVAVALDDLLTKATRDADRYVGSVAFA